MIRPRSVFNLRRTLALFRVESRLLLSDRPALVLIFGLPVMQIALYGYAVNFMPRHVPVAFATNDAAMSLQAPALFRDDPVVRLAGAIGTLGDAQGAVRRGDAMVGIEIAKPTADGPRRNTPMTKHPSSPIGGCTAMHRGRPGP